MHSDEVRIFSNDLQGNLVFFNDDQEEKRVATNVGIVGQCFTTGENINVMNCYENKDYSPEIDLNTTMPVITQCIRHKHASEILGVI